MKRTWTGLYVPEATPESPSENFTPLTPKDYAVQLEGLATFAAHPDVRCIWEFNPAEGELPGLALEPGVNSVPDSDCSIISAWFPGKLLVHSPIALRAGIFSVRISHTVLFDSNLYNYIVKFVDCPRSLSAAQASGIRTLLKWLIVRNYDYQLMPYVLESYSKNNSAVAYEYALRGTRALLQLHTMDRRYFLNTGTIRPDPTLIALYEPEFGTTNLDDIAQAQLNPYLARTAVPVRVIVHLIALMKCVLIRHFEKAGAGLNAQWAAFDDFLFTKLGFHAATLRFVAALYFAGRLDGWIKVQPNSSCGKALSSLQNCAWDLYLGSISQDILASCPEDNATLAHFCTRETELAQLLGLFSIYCLRVYHNGNFVPFISVDTETLIESLGPSGTTAFALAEQRAAAFSVERKHGRTAPGSMDNIENLLVETEDALRARLRNVKTAP